MGKEGEGGVRLRGSHCVAPPGPVPLLPVCPVAFLRSQSWPAGCSESTWPVLAAAGGHLVLKRDLRWVLSVLSLLSLLPLLPLQRSASLRESLCLALQVVCEVEDVHAGEIIQTLTLRKGEVRASCLTCCSVWEGGGRLG